MSGLVLLCVLMTLVEGYTLRGDDLLEALVAKRKGKDNSHNSPHKEDPEIAVVSSEWWVVGGVLVLCCHCFGVVLQLLYGIGVQLF